MLSGGKLIVIQKCPSLCFLTSLSTRLSPGSSGLDLELLTPLLERLQALLSPSGQVDVHRGPHSGAQVSWAGVDVAELLAEEEVLAALGLDGVANGLDAAGKALEHTLKDKKKKNYNYGWVWNVCYIQ